MQKAAVNGGGVAVGKVRKGRKRKEGAKGKGKADVAEVAKAEVEVVAKVAAKKEIVVDGRHAADSQDGDCVGSPTTASCMSQGCMPGSSSPRGEKAESREVSCGRSETEPSAGPSSPNVDVSMGCNEVGGEVRDDLVAAAEAMLAKGDVHAPTVETFPDGIFGAGCDVGEVKMYPVRNGSPVGIVERCALAERRNGMEREIGKLGDELRVLDEHRAFLDQCWKDVNERQGRLLKEYEAMEQKMLDIHLMRQQTLTNHLFIKGELERRSVEFQRLNTVMGPGM